MLLLPKGKSRIGKEKRDKVFCLVSAGYFPYVLYPTRFGTYVTVLMIAERLHGEIGREEPYLTRGYTVNVGHAYTCLDVCTYQSI